LTVVPVRDANRHLDWSHMFSVTEALAALRFRHLGYHVMKPGDFANFSIS